MAPGLAHARHERRCYPGFSCPNLQNLDVHGVQGEDECAVYRAFRCAAAGAAPGITTRSMSFTAAARTLKFGENCPDWVAPFLLQLPPLRRLFAHRSGGIRMDPASDFAVLTCRSALLRHIELKDCRFSDEVCRTYCASPLRSRPSSTSSAVGTSLNAPSAFPVCTARSSTR